MIDDSAKNPTPDDAIDRVIRDALRSEVDSERVARLEHFWRVQSQRNRWRRTARRVLVTAAATIASVAIGTLAWHRSQQHFEARSKPDSGKAIAESPPKAR